MLGGFDPRFQELFVRRNRGGALAWGLLVLAAIGTTAWLAYPPPKEDVVEVQLEAEIQDFAVEEEPEPEPEPEPPPPPDTKVEVVSKPKPKPEPQVDEPKPKPRPKAEIDPTVPIDRPENATAPKQKSGDAPEYPKDLRDKGITGKVVLKLHVHRDGTVRGAKILRKSNTATTEEDKALADKLLVAAVIKAVKTWSFEPAKLDGQPITVWHTVTVPFTLTAG